MHNEQQIVDILSKKVKNFPEMVMVLGSGWNKVVGPSASSGLGPSASSGLGPSASSGPSGIEIEQEIGFEELLGVKASVPGHEGKLMITKVKEISNKRQAIRRVAFMQGRVHMYEGYTAREATTPIRVFNQMGAKRLVLTAACGALNEKYKVGDFVVLSDLLTLFLALDNPLVGPEFVDMSEVFDSGLRNMARKVCVTREIPFHEGVYAYYHGPNFETPADKMALRHMGADVVGMSTVPETIMARALGMEVLGLAFVTNLAFVKHDHHKVLAEASKASGQMVELLRGIMERV